MVTWRVTGDAGNNNKVRQVCNLHTFIYISFIFLGNTQMIHRFHLLFV